MINKTKYAILAVTISGMFGTLQSCISSPDSNTSQAISPGLYPGIFNDQGSQGDTKAYFKQYSNGDFENRQYSADSMVWFHSMGHNRFVKDSVYASEVKIRTYEEGLEQGAWGEWKSMEDRATKIDSVYVEIKDGYFELRLDPKVRFDKIGGENAAWPPSKNKI